MVAANKIRENESLWRLWKAASDNGDVNEVSILDRVLELNAPLAHSCLTSCKLPPVASFDEDDMLQEIMLGMLDSFKKWFPENGFSICSFMMRGGLWRVLSTYNEKSRLIHIPKHICDKIVKLRKENDSNIQEDDVFDALRTTGVKSFNETVSENGWTYGDIITEDGQDDHLRMSSIDENAVEEVVCAAIDRMFKAKDANVIKLRLGLNGFEEKSASEIAQLNGCTKQYISCKLRNCYAKMAASRTFKALRKELLGK